MDVNEFKNDLFQEVKVNSSITGEGSSACFAQIMADYLIESDVLSDYNPAYYKGQKRRMSFRVNGYVYDDFDETMTLIIVDYDGVEEDRTLTKSVATNMFKQLRNTIQVAIETDFYKDIEISTPCADLIDLLRINEKRTRRYRLLLFTDGAMSDSIKTIEINDFNGIPVEPQIWDIDRLYRVCVSDQGKQILAINFLDYCEEGIPCLDASSLDVNQYDSYLGVIPGTVLANIYDTYGSKLLEGNVRSFLSTKVAVNKKIRNTILNAPEMFFAFNNGISVTASNVKINETNHGRFITYAEDFQIINGGQTTASISNARYRDKASLDKIFVQMKLTAIDKNEISNDEVDNLIQNISRSSNSQNKVSDADFFASHPFHRRMEQISRHTFAPAEYGAQYETIWFYERARGQYLQEQMRLTPKQKRAFGLKNPKNKLIKKTDLAKVQNCWLEKPHIVSKGAQTNFTNFADYIDAQWNKDDAQFNERYFKSTAALLLMLKYLEKAIPKQIWYQGGYRANIIYYTLSLFHMLIKKQFYEKDLDLMIIWNKQDVPELLQEILLELAELVLDDITDDSRKSANVTQWCKKEDCWQSVKKIHYVLPDELDEYLLSSEEKKVANRNAKKEQRVINGINYQTEVISHSVEFWVSLATFVAENRLISVKEASILKVAIKMNPIPSEKQSKILLSILERAKENGFNDSAAGD